MVIITVREPDDVGLMTWSYYTCVELQYLVTIRAKQILISWLTKGKKTRSTSDSRLCHYVILIFGDVIKR